MKMITTALFFMIEWNFNWLVYFTYCIYYAGNVNRNLLPCFFSSRNSSCSISFFLLSQEHYFVSSSSFVLIPDF